MESMFTETSFGRLHAQVEGQGKAVVLVHGRNPEFNSWKTWERNIQALGSRSQVFALDLPGYGDADKPQPILDTRSQAKAIIELIDAKKLAPIVLIGLSWGGLIAQTVVDTAPEKVEKLVLVDSGYDESERGLARLARIKLPTLIIWDEEDSVIPVTGAQFLGKSIRGSTVRILKHAQRDPDAKPTDRHWSQMTHSREWNRQVIAFLMGEPT